jgi:hypothetical protein
MIIGNIVGIGSRGGGTVVSSVDGSPNGLTLIVLNSTTIKADWTNGATNQDGSYVFISTNAVDYVLKGTVTGTTATFNATSLLPFVRYYIYIISYKGISLSSASNVANEMISTLLDNLVFSLGHNGTDFINSVTGTALTNNNTVAVGAAIYTDSGSSADLGATNTTKSLTTPMTSDLEVLDNDFTVCVRFKLPSVTTTQILCGQWNTTGNKRSWDVQVNSSTIRLQMSADGLSTGIHYQTRAGLSANVEHTFFAWYDHVADKIYVQLDDASIDNVDHAGGGYDSDIGLTIGCQANSTNYTSGLLNLSIWKGRILTSIEKQFLLRLGAGNAYPFKLNMPSTGDATEAGITKVILMGDKSGDSNNTQSAAVNTVLMAQSPNMIIGTGDFYGNASSTVAQLAANLSGVMYGTPGNHESDAAGVRATFSPVYGGLAYKKVITTYADFFLYDYYRALDTSGASYLSLAAARALSLTERQASNQGYWLIEALLASTKKFKIVVLHDPPYASPSDYSTPDIIVEAANMQWDWKALGVDLIIAGHFHFYERLLIDTGSGNVPCLITGTSGTTDTLGWTSVRSGSVIRISKVTDADFLGGFLNVLTIGANSLTIDISAIKSDYSVVAGKDQLVITK